MKIKDVTFISVFSVLFFIAFLAIACVTGLTPFTFPFTQALGSIPCGIIYMYMRAKQPKRGSILFMGMLVAVIAFVLGIGWCAAVGILVGSIFSEVISARGNYRNQTINIVGYVLYITGFWIGQFSFMLFAGASYKAEQIRHGTSAQYIDTMLRFLNSPLIAIPFIATIVGAIVGGIIGLQIFKKHFAKIV